MVKQMFSDIFKRFSLYYVAVVTSKYCKFSSLSVGHYESRWTDELGSRLERDQSTSECKLNENY